MLPRFFLPLFLNAFFLLAPAAFAEEAVPTPQTAVPPPAKATPAPKPVTQANPAPAKAAPQAAPAKPVPSAAAPSPRQANPAAPSPAKRSPQRNDPAAPKNERPPPPAPARPSSGDEERERGEDIGNAIGAGFNILRDLQELQEIDRDEERDEQILEVEGEAAHYIGALMSGRSIDPALYPHVLAIAKAEKVNPNDRRRMDLLCQQIVMTLGSEL